MGGACGKPWGVAYRDSPGVDLEFELLLGDDSGASLARYLR